MNSPIIEIKNLSKYYGKSRGIEDINLEINEGDIFGFIGPNGAGKSTTIRILLNLIFPTSGRASIFGMDVTRESKKIKEKIGYIPSDANLYDRMDVHEFLRYCSQFYNVTEKEKRIREFADLFELDLKRKVTELSTGNKKKVAIIQSLVHNPELLILDEPTTGLDPLMQARFFEVLRKENQRGMTVFFSSHVLSEVQTICKRVAVVKEGKIVNVEDIKTLRNKQLRKVRIEFIKEMPFHDLGISGIETIIVNKGKTYSFMYSGKIDQLVGALSQRKIENLIIEEPTLEEIFLHYYK